MNSLLSLVLAPLLLAAWPASAQDGRPAPEVPEAAATLGALGADDECRAGDAREQCGLAAMQLRRRTVAQGEMRTTDLDTIEAPAKGDAKESAPAKGDTGKATPSEGDVKEAQPAEEPQPPSGPQLPYAQCGGKDYKGSTECTEGFECFNIDEYFSMCKPKTERTWKKYNSSDILDKESTAPSFTFYMYRALDPGATAPLSANAASIGAIMWYLHEDVVSCQNCPRVRSYGIDRIARYKVQTKATRPLESGGMNFGLTLSFEDGRCTGMGECDEMFAKYGYYVGCNNLSAGFPYPAFPVSYTGALYSLPAGCTANDRNEKSLECKRDQPGGLCKGAPTGNGTCTWSYTDAGVVTLDALEGIENYTAFKESGGEEYNKTADAGIEMTFWDGLKDPVANAARIKKLDALFKEKYPDMPSDAELPAPACDFNQKAFLSHVPGFGGEEAL